MVHGAQEQDRWRGERSQRKQRPEVGVRSKQNALLFRRGLQNLGIGCGQQPDVRDMDASCPVSLRSRTTLGERFASRSSFTLPALQLPTRAPAQRLLRI